MVTWVLVRQRDWFFFLVQSEYGDLYKISLEYDGDAVNEVKVKYFDTVQVSVCLAVLKTGFMFVGAESGNQYIFLLFFFFGTLKFIFCPQKIGRGVTKITDVAAKISPLQVAID